MDLAVSATTAWTPWHDHKQHSHYTYFTRKKIVQFAFWEKSGEEDREDELETDRAYDAQ